VSSPSGLGAAKPDRAATPAAKADMAGLPAGSALPAGGLPEAGVRAADDDARELNGA